MTHPNALALARAIERLDDIKTMRDQLDAETKLVVAQLIKLTGLMEGSIINVRNGTARVARVYGVERDEYLDKLCVRVLCAPQTSTGYHASRRVIQLVPIVLPAEPEPDHRPKLTCHQCRIQLSPDHIGDCPKCGADRELIYV